jgi:phenylalanyl-tRNA synthetase beta chain
VLVPISWLKEYVDIDLTPDALAEALTMAGLETGVAGGVTPSVPGVITARIEKIEPHPNADKLTVCQVRTAPDAAPLTVVCGAPNIREGNIVPLARPGAVFPDGSKLKKSKIRGIESDGMMCSQRELGISDDHSGIWILPPETPIGLPLAEALGGGDAILEPEPTPNRGDLLCVLGLAREIAAVTGKTVRPPKVEVIEDGPPIAELARVDIEHYEGCPRYVARLIRGVKIGPSPKWLTDRLEAAGMRGINNVVDVTNFVMLELGQPLHAFDYNRLIERRIVVRMAAAGDKFITLDDQEHTLRDDTLMICDGAGPVAIAGVMGGLDSEVAETTTDVLIESAYFNPVVIRRTARLLNIPTEASRRFDKGVDPLGTALAADRAAAMIKELGGGTICAGAIDARQGLFARACIAMRPARVNQVLGVDLSAAEQVKAITRLPGLTAVEKDGVIEVTAPSYRPDLVAEHDLIEEVARLVGYDQIPATMPCFRMEPMRRSAGLDFSRKLRERLAALGFAEAVLTNFEDPTALATLRLPENDPRLRAVKLHNPLAQNESILRASLLPKLVACLARNRNQGATGAIRLFEINATFEDAGEELPLQRPRLALVMAAPTEKSFNPAGGAEDFFGGKAVVEQILAAVRFPGARLEADPDPEPFLHPGRCARVMVGGDAAGRLGQLHPLTAAALGLKQDAFVFEVRLDLLAEHAGHVPKGEPVSKFPPTLRDMALLVDESVTMGEIVKTATKMKSPILESLTLFDLFRGGSLPAGQKSMAFHVRYQSGERTLTDDEVNREHERLAVELARKHKAVRR